MTEQELMHKVAAAREWYEALSPAQKDCHDYAQKRSFVLGMCPSNMGVDEWRKVVDQLMPPPR